MVAIKTHQTSFITKTLGSLLLTLSLSLFFTFPAKAETRGFQLNLFEPTAAGEWSLLVDHPWYSSTRYFAGGVTLNYAHNPSAIIDQLGNRNLQLLSPIEHQLLGHVDLAGSFLDRFLITLSLPITLYEGEGVQVGSQRVFGPISSGTVAVGDPRLGLMVRIFGQPYRSPISLSGGAEVWFPINSYTNSFPSHVGENSWRFRLKAALGGLSHHVLWSLLASYYYRPDGFFGTTEDRTNFATFRSSQLQIGASIAYADKKRRFSIGPEALFTTTLSNDLDTASKTAFRTYSTSLEVLLGIHYNIASQVQLSLGGGLGFFFETGTPDARALLRIAYAPMRKPPAVDRDTDKDGVENAIDKCPQQPGPAKNQGCPEPAPSDQDKDGVMDKEDKCIDVPQGKNPDPNKKGCPLIVEVKQTPEIKDRDVDGIKDEDDGCPDVPGPIENNGCPPAPQRKLIVVSEAKIQILQKIQFATGKSTIKPPSFPILEEVISVMTQRPKMKIKVEGHTDNKGNAKKNLELSQKRAQAVKQYLVSHGIESSRVETEGFGDKKPMADNKKITGRDQNRRIEFIILP